MATTIEWVKNTDGTNGVVWNPTTGCDRVSPGCDNCYALTMAKRLKAMGSAKYQVDGDPRTSGPGFGVTMHPDVLAVPLGWAKPRDVFVNSMSDLFHDGVTDEFIAQVFAVMAVTPQHTYKILTKRHGRMRALLNSPNWRGSVAGHVRAMNPDQPLAEFDALTYDFIGTGVLPHVWLGVSVEDQKWADIRIPALLGTPAAVRWLSMEPLLGPVDLWGKADRHGHRSRLTYWLDGRPYWGEPRPEPTSPKRILMQELETGPAISWVVTGGESGPGARPLDLDWVRSIRDQCQQSGVPFFHKQNGGRTPKATGRELDGRTWDEMPERAL